MVVTKFHFSSFHWTNSTGSFNRRFTPSVSLSEFFGVEDEVRGVLMGSSENLFLESRGKDVDVYINM